MALAIATNNAALNAAASASSVNRDMETSMARLSSGKRINSASDDAAGVAISSRLSAEIRGTDQAIRNALDGQALIDTAEGAHSEIENILQRMREVSVQAANDTNNDQDRANLQAEMNALVTEIDRIAGTTTWAGEKLMEAEEGSPFSFQVGAKTETKNQIDITINGMGAHSLGLQADSDDVVHTLSDVSVGTSADTVAQNPAFDIRQGTISALGVVTPNNGNTSITLPGLGASFADVTYDTTIPSGPGSINAAVDAINAATAQTNISTTVGAGGSDYPGQIILKHNATGDVLPDGSSHTEATGLGVHLDLDTVYTAYDTANSDPAATIEVIGQDGVISFHENAGTAFKLVLALNNSTGAPAANSSFTIDTTADLQLAVDAINGTAGAGTAEHGYTASIVATPDGSSVNGTIKLTSGSAGSGFTQVSLGNSSNSISSGSMSANSIKITGVTFVSGQFANLVDDNVITDTGVTVTFDATNNELTVKGTATRAAHLEIDLQSASGNKLLTSVTLNVGDTQETIAAAIKTAMDNVSSSLAPVTAHVGSKTQITRDDFGFADADTVTVIGANFKDIASKTVDGFTIDLTSNIITVSGTANANGTFILDTGLTDTHDDGADLAVSYNNGDAAAAIINAIKAAIDDVVGSMTGATTTLISEGKSSGSDADFASGTVAVEIKHDTPVKQTTELISNEVSAFSEVVGLPNGNHALTWAVNSSDGNGYAIYYRELNGSGKPEGEEVILHTSNIGAVDQISSTSLSDGIFAFIWADYSNDQYKHATISSNGDLSNIKNLDLTSGPSGGASVASLSIDGLSDGKFAISFTDGPDDTENSLGINYSNNPNTGQYVQLYSNIGVQIKDTFALNDHVPGSTHNYFSASSLSALKNGGFISTWTSYYLPGDNENSSVSARIFDPSGNATAPQFQVNDFTTSYQHKPIVTTLNDGSFVILWENNHSDIDGSGRAIVAEHYRADGTIMKSDFLANKTTNFNQWIPKVTPLWDGGYFVAYTHSYAFPDSVELGQRYDKNSNPVGEEIVIQDPFVESNLYILSDKGFISIFRKQDGSLASNSFFTKSTALATLNNESSSSRPITTPQKVGGEFKINTSNTNNTSDIWTAPVTVLADGSFVVTWEAVEAPGSYNSGIFAQIYDASGAASGSEFQIGSFAVQPNHMSSPSSAALPDGGFVVTWTSGGQDGDGLGLRGQRFDASGVTVGPELQVNTGTGNQQESSSVTALSDGGFVVTWESYLTGGFEQIGSGLGIFGQRYDAAGDAVGVEFQINTTADQWQEMSNVEALSGGGFVVTWSTLGDDGTSYNIFGQRYDASGTVDGAEFQVNATANDEQWVSTTAGLTDGGFVVTWTSNIQDGDGYGIYGQRYDAAGVAAGGEFQINMHTSGDQQFTDVTALPDGGFVVTWTSNGQDGDSDGVYGQRFDAVGGAVGAEFQINTFTNGQQQTPSVAAMPDGRLVVTWSSDGQDTSEHGVYGQIFDVSTSSSFGSFSGSSSSSTSVFSLDLGAVGYANKTMTSSDGSFDADTGVFTPGNTNTSGTVNLTLAGEEITAEGISEKGASPEADAATIAAAINASSHGYKAEVMTGADAGKVKIKQPAAPAKDMDVTDDDKARETIVAIDAAIQKVNIQRSSLGAVSNRLSHTINNLTNISSNLSAAQGGIEDADFAKETTDLAKNQILQQASTAMLAQANASKQNVLSLLQG